MSKYVKALIVTEEFEGDKVRFEIHPVTMAQQLEIEDLAPEAPPRDDGEREVWRKARFSTDAEYAAWLKDQVDKATTMFRVSRQLLHESVVSLSGLKDAAGGDVSVDEVFVSAYFDDLVTAVFKKWWTARKPARPEMPTSQSVADSPQALDPPQVNAMNATVG